MEKTYPKGIYYNLPHENAPQFVLGSISIKKDDFMNWLAEKEPNEKGYVRLSILSSKQDNKPYIAVDDYQK